MFVRIGWWSVPLLAGVRGSVDETFSPVLPKTYIGLEDGRVAVPPLKESCALRQGCKFTLMIVVMCTRFYLIDNRRGSPNT